MRVEWCSSFSIDKSQNFTTKVFGSTDRQRPTDQGSNCTICRSKSYLMMAGPQDTLNEKGQIEIDEVESIQSSLDDAVHQDAAGHGSPCQE